MTHQDECPAINDLTALLIEHGPAAMASALATLMNHAIQIEREQVLQAGSTCGSRRPVTIAMRTGGRFTPGPSSGASAVSGP